MKKICFLFFVFLGLCGCESPRMSENFVPRFSEYVGQTEKDLVRDFGRPDMIYHEETEDERLRVYLIYNTVSLNRVYSGMPNYECRTIFLMSRERVVASFYDLSTCIVPGGKKN